MTMPRVRVAERVRTATPVAPADPFARTGDPLARAMDPLAMAADPLARSIDAFTRASDPLVRAAARAGDVFDPFRKRNRSPGNRKVRRISILPPYMHRPRTSINWVVPANELFYAYEEPTGCRTFAPGDGFDFTEVGQLVAAQQECEEVLEDPEHGHPLYVVRLDPEDPPWVAVDQDWQCFWDERAFELWRARLLPLITTMRQRVLANPAEAFVSDPVMGGIVAHKALQMGGYLLDEGFWTGDMLIEELMGAVDQDPSVANATADMVAMEYPGMLGDDEGMEMRLAFQAADEVECYVTHPDDQQYFMLDGQFVPAGMSSWELEGKHMVTGCRYLSAFDHPDTTPEGMIAWRECELMPVDEDWQPR